MAKIYRIYNAIVCSTVVMLCLNPHLIKKIETMNRIYLIGYMGAGKTTLGKKLAKVVDANFIDLDKFIECKYHKTVPDIFEEHGEEGFRLIEQSALLEVSEIENVIISTGGGAPCFFDNMKVMNDSGLTIYIKATPEELASRLRASKTVRPIVASKADDELIPFIAKHLTEREEFYNQAKVSFHTEHLVSKEDIDITVDRMAYEIKNLNYDIR